jgi:hypothetical protein
VSRKSAKSRSRAEILAGETRCIYCACTSADEFEIEHMPPRWMFKTKSRPSGLEFVSCRTCNNGTSAADLVAGFIARISPLYDQEDWKMVEARSRQSTLNVKAPGFLNEFFDPSRSQLSWVPDAAGILKSMVVMKADGPVQKSYLDVFAAKLGMALYREHCGVPMPLNAGVFSAVFMNSGLMQESVATMLSVMPLGAGLTQGPKNTAHDQFFYRFNSDDRSVIAALVGFHDGLYVCTIALGDPVYEQKLVVPPMWRHVRPGELIGMMPIQSRTWVVRQQQPQPEERAIDRLLAALTPRAGSGDPKS